jgi:hypothetical protein
MFSRIRARLTFANVTSVIALFFAVGGTSAYAINEWNGSNIQDESLTGADVKGVNGTQTVKGVNGSLTGADISGQPAIAAVGQNAVDGSLTTYDLKDGWVRGVDLQANTLTGTQIDESTLGPVPNATTADQLNNIVVKQDSFSNPEGHQSVGEVSCDPGYKASGGGAYASGSLEDRQELNGTGPALNDTKWDAYYDNQIGADGSDGGGETFTVYAICIRSPDAATASAKR